MFQIVKPGTNWDFMGKQKAFFALSTLLILGSLLSLFAIGPNFGIDFRGGTDIILHFDKDVTAEEVRTAATEAGLTAPSVQRFGAVGENRFLVQTSDVSVVDQERTDKLGEKLAGIGELTRKSWSPEQPDRFDLVYASPVEISAIEKIVEADGFTIAKKEGDTGTRVEKIDAGVGHAYVVRFQDLGTKVRKGFAKALPEAFNEKEGLNRLETVGARVGDQLREDGLTAVLLALVAILIYIAVRFDIRYAPGAVVALFHDVIFAMGVLTITGMEINLPILASILTIVGYSLNDTIVVFDRIRENYTAGRGGSNLYEIINTSLNETLSRTLITSLTTVFAVATIAIVGSGLIENFAITLLIGVIIGTYSSICVASPIMLMMDTFMRNRQKAKDLIAARETTVEPSEA